MVASNISIKIKLLEHGKQPARQTSGSSGYDLFAAESATLQPQEARLIKLGFLIEIPFGYEAQIRSRSGFALKHQLFVLNSPGTIDSDYRQEVGCLLMNLGKQPVEILLHTRIAQMVFAKVECAHFVSVDELETVEERTSGWGSTGK